MAGELRKVRPGDPVDFSASTWNAMIDAAKAQRARDQGRDPSRDIRQTGIVLVRNDSGADRVRCEVLGISGSVLSPADSPDEFKRRAVLVGTTPTTAAYKGKFVILIEPVLSGKIGLAVVSGIVPVQLEVTTENTALPFADVKDNACNALVPIASGAARILWKAAGTGTVWGIVCVGSGSGGTAEDGTAQSPYTGTAEWNRASPPAGTDGVRFDVVLNVSWDGTKLEQTRATLTFDSKGALLTKGAETTTTVVLSEICT